MNKNIFIHDDNFLSDLEIKETYNTTALDTRWQFREELGSNDGGYAGVYGGNYADYPFFVSSGENIDALCLKIINKFLKKYNLELEKTLRMRTNLSTRQINKNTSRPHLDSMEEDHYVFIYYVNDSDGSTIIYNEFSDGKFFTNKDITIFKEFEPKAGTGILFPGRQFHSWSAPIKNNHRIILNMNIILKDLG